MCICSYLYTAVYSGFLNINKFKDMICSFIEETPTSDIPYWIFDLAVLSEKEDILNILYECSWFEYDNYFETNNYSHPLVILGYFYWLYKNGEITTNEFLDSACTTDETYDVISSSSNEEKLNDELYDYCNDYMIEAQRQFKLLCNWFESKE